jgi:hypothetical protein
LLVLSVEVVEVEVVVLLDKVQFQVFQEVIGP